MDFGNQFNQAGTLASQLAPSVAPENPLMSLMRDYVRAKERFDELCHARQQVLQQHNDAEKQLAQLSEKVAQVITQGVYDPTAPQPAPTNGLTGLTGGMQGFGQTRF